MLSTPRKRALAGLAAVAIGALALSACTSQRGGGGETDAATDVDGTFVFAASADPASLDPAFAQDGETFRVSRQIFEGLVGTEPGTADPAPLLAESWESSEDGLTHTFQLKEGVTFHDGTPFNAEAVCANFDRWYNWTGLAASEALSYYYGKLFRGYVETPDTAVFDSCTADGDLEATVTLKQPFAGFIPALSLPAFAMQSPTALEEYGADEIGGTEEAPSLSEYGAGHPTGTGPYKFDEWSPGEELTLSAYDDYWGESGQVNKIIFRVIDDPTARRQALEAGSIDGYDLVGPADTAALEEAGFTMVSRPPFTILYLAFNQAQPELQDVRVREALSHAIDKEALISQVLPEGTEVATQFMPDTVNGYNPDVTTYDYDPEKAKALLAEAGYTEANPLTLTFNYPVNVSRPYMPDPEQIATVISTQLTDVGVQLTPQTDAWSPDYLDKITGTADHGIHLLGWTGDYNDTDNFVGVFFGAPSAEWGFDNPELFAALNSARGVPNLEEQTALYEQINEQVAQFIPGVPLAHPAPTLAFDPRVESYPASPVNDEVFTDIVLTE
ncbi:ABC transporter substrate-binding protein [Microbacterium sp. AISO3]|uniref:Peptide/nickel transport system substrate-binding protein n=2 Tax=Microbacterium TaxID=33882 RepID=A0ABU1I0Y8_9MICO|nr:MULTISPECIES: ABC transporter substrate-binding protein [Microbacterium]APF34988.1 ABC transporter substrate-binding protein [Microbacterium paludicola]MDR6167559.1 peptide/nickel transport system substrate-binding protein [Microbacterium paludicola]OAZ43980.1 peptide ABC transporter substrate-binding protein [Microbacterium arborescens]OWP21262.1 ABC transporter substrate-binding protein [Microbacterium sp. AISO3]QCR41460.1 ABC transporter substrate-binding protein [Microbacterium sp. SGAi